MLLSPNAFVHVPMLAGKIIEPEKSTFRVSLATFEDWDRRAAQAGYGPNWRRSHQDREATRTTALAGRLNDDLWVFAYGSLMWDPALHIVEIRRATLQGFHRRFCLKAEIGRGSKEAPALMAALDVGGECQGLAFRIPAEAVNHETEILWMREMIGEAYLPTFRSVLTPQGAVEALAFAIDRTSRRFADLSTAEAAAIIASGKGCSGQTLSTSTIWLATLPCLGSRMRCSRQFDLSYVAPDDTSRASCRTTTRPQHFHDQAPATHRYVPADRVARAARSGARVRYWHLADMTTALSDVRFWG
jgi:cation transport protein ChaC